MNIVINITRNNESLPHYICMYINDERNHSNLFKMSMGFMEGHILNILVVVLVISFGEISSQYDGDEDLTGYTETCTCSKSSANEQYCVAWSCDGTYHYSAQKCFSGQSTVVTHEGKAISLSNIHIGQEVLVFDGNALVFEPIYDIIHSEKNKILLVYPSNCIEF